MKNKKIILITSLVIILLIIIGVILYLFLGTDLFKSDKELFAKYTLQAFDEDFIPTELENYYNKKYTSKYEDNGSITYNTQFLTQVDQEYIDLINMGNNVNISFNGKVDKQNRKNEQDININYSNNTSMGMTYKQDGDYYGVQFDDISESFITVENNNLKLLFQNLGVEDVSSIPNQIPFNDYLNLFTNEDKEHIYNNYLVPIYNDIPDENFSKIESDNGDVTYTLTLKDMDAKNIVLQFLEILQNDTYMIDKINDIGLKFNLDTSQITSENIGQLINDGYETIDEELLSEDLIIEIIQNDEIVTNININIEDANISIDKSEDEENIIYNAHLTSDDDDNNITVSFNLNKSNGTIYYYIPIVINDLFDPINVFLEFKYEGLESNTVNETMTLTINSPNEATSVYTYSNQINFSDNIEISDFASTDVILNNYNSEDLQTFILQLLIRVNQINELDMQEIGYTGYGNIILDVWFEDLFAIYY